MRSQLTERLTAADPAHGVDLRVPQVAWRDLVDAITTTDRESDGSETADGPGPKTAPRRARRAAIVLVAAAALIAAPVGFNLAGRPSGASVAAAGVLERAAISAVDPAAKPGQYWKITTTGGSIATLNDTRGGADVFANWWVSDTIVDYVAVDGDRPTFTDRRNGDIQRQISGEPGVGRSEPSVSIETNNLTPNDLPGGWQTPNRGFLDSLPTDVTTLRERLYADAEGHGNSPDGEVLVLVADVLRSGLVPAERRSALYQVLKTVPGVDVTASAVTIQGRTGVAIARTETVDGARQEIIIDPKNGLLIGERTVVVESSMGLPVGTVITETSITRALVDAVPAQIRATAHHSVCSTDSDNAIVCSSPKAEQPAVG